MNYSEKYYKELLAIKETKNFLLEESYLKSKTYPEEYKFHELKRKLDKINTLFELNIFADCIALNKKDKGILNRQLHCIQQGALSTFCTYITEEPIGFSYTDDIDNDGEYYASFSDDDSDISSRDALDEIINDLGQLEEYQRVIRLERILKDEIYAVCIELSNSVVQVVLNDDKGTEYIEKMPQVILEYRISQYNKFIADLIRDMYLWFNLDVIDVLTKGQHNKLSQILNVGEMTIERFTNIKELVIKEKNGEINSENLDEFIESEIKIPNKPKLTKETQPLLTQHQIIILFENLRRERVINKDVSGSMLGFCISQLVGYKTGHSIRQAYSESYTDIENKKENRVAVITLLENIINRLKKDNM